MSRADDFYDICSSGTAPFGLTAYSGGTDCRRKIQFTIGDEFHSFGEDGVRQIVAVLKAWLVDGSSLQSLRARLPRMEDEERLLAEAILELADRL